MKPQNAPEIRKSYFNFLARFSLLLGAALICIYCFFRAHQSQLSSLNERYVYYNDLYNRQLQLGTKVDSLYYYLSLLNTDQVQNDIFLEKYITDKKDEINKLVGADSTGEFLMYSRIVNNLNTILSNKDSIRRTLSQESFIREALNDCMRNTDKLKKKLDNNPVRFTPALNSKS